jgi:hypothetical protein
VAVLLLMRSLTKCHVLWGALGCALFGLVSIGSTCDLEGDQCDDSLNHCQGNVAIACYRPGAEVHSREQDTPCTGTDDTCFLDPTGYPFCGRGPASTCPMGNTCNGDDVVHCNQTLDGGYAYTDLPCADSLVNSHCVDIITGYPDAGITCK